MDHSKVMLLSSYKSASRFINHKWASMKPSLKHSITYWKERIVTNVLKVDKYYGLSNASNINTHFLRNDFNITNMP